MTDVLINIFFHLIEINIIPWLIHNEDLKRLYKEFTVTLFKYPDQETLQKFTAVYRFIPVLNESKPLLLADSIIIRVHKDE